MNIDELTIGQARILAALFQSPGGSGCAYEGKYVIVRTYSAGVHVGVLKSLDGTKVVLADSRRIWSWSGAFTLSEISIFGISSGRMSVPVPEILLTEAVEVIPASVEAEKCLRTLETHRP